LLIFKEALTNIARHAKATRAGITLEAHGGELCMEISDNGRGILARAPRRAGTIKSLGLVGMRERVRSAGGQLTIGNGPGRGTRLTVTIPTPPGGAPTPMRVRKGAPLQ
jgi:signal transduction histidine kinase